MYGCLAMLNCSTDYAVSRFSNKTDCKLIKCCLCHNEGSCTVKDLTRYGLEGTISPLTCSIFQNSYDNSPRKSLNCWLIDLASLFSLDIWIVVEVLWELPNCPGAEHFCDAVQIILQDYQWFICVFPSLLSFAKIRLSVIIYFHISAKIKSQLFIPVS